MLHPSSLTDNDSIRISKQEILKIESELNRIHFSLL